MLRNFIFKITLYTWFLLWAPILAVGLISSRLERRLMLIETFGVLSLARNLGGIKYEIIYPKKDENGIPFKHNVNSRLDGRTIIASKHMSIMEVAILFYHVPKSFFILKRELLWIPVYGWAFARIGLIGVNRSRGKTNMKDLVNRVTKKIMNDMTLIIFPEGTRVKPNQNVPLKRGLLFIAEQLKLPITPVGVDTGLYWPKRGRIHPGTTKVYFEPELPSSASMDDIRSAINKHSC